MKKRSRLVVGLSLGAIAIGACLMLGLFRSPRLRAENYARIRVGMTQAEVEELLGGPPGNYGGFVWYVLQSGGWMSMEGYMRPPDSVERIWNDDDSRLEIYFNAEGRVTGHHERAKYQHAPDGFLKDLWRRARYKVGL